jgi:DeoR family glycerol-3-phosphate regulon repressor
MILTSRQQEIMLRIRQSGSVQVDDLAGILGVTTQTVRRDLNELCDCGLAARIHGGARESRSVTNTDYEKRRLMARREKEKIATLAASLIPDACSVMMNIGTTTEQVAHSLYSHKDLVVISNNINIINILINSPDKELILAGGTIRASDGAVVGSDAVEFISRYKADYAIIGTSAIDPDGSILDYDQREVSVARAILKNARVKILVADSGKFNHTATVRICNVGDLDYFVTDRLPGKRFLAAAGTTQIIVPES